MKTIGVIGAMPEEVSLLRDRMTDLQTTKTAGLTVYTGILHGKKVALCQSGMGKVAAGAAAQVLCSVFRIDAIINSGIAGNMTAKVGIGDVVLSEEVTYHDAQIDMINQAYPNMDSYMGNENMLFAAEKACKEVGTYCIRGKIATGDLFIGDKETKAKIAAFCSPDCVEMEGAAIAHIACKNDIPFLVIRAMSDNAEASADEFRKERKFKISEYCDTAADICEKTIKYIEF